MEGVGARFRISGALAFGTTHVLNLPKIRRRGTKASKLIYDFRAKKEDKIFSPINLLRFHHSDNQKGIYTVINVKKYHDPK